MVVAAKTKGTGFRGLAAYLEKGSPSRPRPDRIEWIEPRNLPTSDPLTVARIMRATANHNANVAAGRARPVEHLSISWDPNDTPTKAQMIEVADRVLKAVGLDRNQALIVAHNDTEHPHVHLLVNRVAPDLRIAPDSQDFWHIQQVLRQAEREFGWRETPGHLWRYPDQQRPTREPTPNQAERRELEQDQRRPFADLVREAARDDFREAANWDDLSARLAAKGLRLEPVGKIGFVVTDGTERCKASDIERDTSRRALERRFGAYDHQRHQSDRSARTDDRDRPDRGGESRRPDAGNHRRDAGHHEPDRARPDRPDPSIDRSREQDSADRHEAHDRRGGVVPDLGNGGRNSRRAYDEVSPWWHDLSRVERQPASLNDALARLEHFDRVAARLKEAEAALTRHDKQLRQMASKDTWGAKVQEEMLHALGKAFRDPERAFSRITSEIERVGVGKATAKLERQPEAFGKMHGWRVAGGILTKKPFTLYASDARREAKSHVGEIGREVRRWAGAERAVKAATIDRPQVIRQRDHARAAVEQLRVERGPSARWELVREIERAAKGAPAPERKALSPERRQALTDIESQQRARFAKLNQDRAQQSKGKQATQERAPSRAPARGRDDPAPER
jgi:hypothetical protein